jgi:nitroreductase
MSESRVAFITNRRSIRKWKKQSVSNEMIDLILEAGKSAPSAHDAQPWEFIVVSQPELIKDVLADRLQQKEPPYWINSKKWAKKLGLEKYTRVDLPPALLVLCGDTKATSFDGLITGLSACAQNMLLAAAALDLGAVWLYVYDPDMPETEKRIKQLLHIPEHVMVFCLLPIGFPDEKPKLKIVQAKKTYVNRWGKT